VWISLVFIAVWFAFRLATSGRAGIVLAGLAVLGIGSAIFVSSPLYTTVDQRFQHGQSNDIRAYLAQQSIQAAEQSPIIGYGGTRHTQATPNSIAIGASPKCPTCGGVATGGTGTLWAIMFNQGYGGIVLYFGFFGLSLWIYRRDRSPWGEAALCTIGLVFVFMFFYDSVPAPLTLTMISVGVLWREKRAASGPVRCRRPALGGVRVG
jgi:O-antigen ligase